MIYNLVKEWLNAKSTAFQEENKDQLLLENVNTGVSILMESHVMIITSVSVNIVINTLNNVQLEKQ